MKDYFYDLAIFDGEGGGGDAGSSAAAPGAEAGTQGTQTPGPETATPKKANLKNVQYGKPAPAAESVGNGPTAEPSPEELKAKAQAEYDDFIKAHKDQDKERIQKIINSRFAETKSLQEKADSYEPIMEMLRAKFGTDDISEIEDKLRYDDETVEERAYENGLTIEQQRKMDTLERELEQYRQTEEERQREEKAREIRANWVQQGEELKLQYPTFDLTYEATNEETGERFRALLERNIDVKTAFEIVHKDEIINNAIARTAQAVQGKIVNDIKSRGQRPAENGGNATAPTVISKPDPSKWSKKDREEVSRRVLRGEKIYL